MRTYSTIAELLSDLHVAKPCLYPDFHIFKFSETSNIKKEALEPHLKRFFSLEFNFDEGVLPGRKIGHTTIRGFRECIMFNSPMQLFSVNQHRSHAESTGMVILFCHSFFKPAKHQFEIQQEFSFFQRSSYPQSKIDSEQQTMIRGLLDSIYSEFTTNDPYSIEIIRSYLLVLLNIIKRVSESNQKGVRQKRYEELNGQFTDMLLEETSHYKTIAEYAQKLNITPIYLSECVKKATGLPAKKVLLNYKVDRAKSLLSQTVKTVEEIAYEMGFEEATNFIKFFKRLQGITPAAYRKEF